MEPQGLEREILWAMKRFGKIPFHDVHRGFSHSEFMVMGTLARHGDRHEGAGMGAAQLAEHTKTSPQALSRTLRALETRGMIQRSADPQDRRHTVIHMTESAKTEMLAGQLRMKYIFEQVITRMGEEDVRTMVALVNRMADLMQTVQAELEEDLTERKE